MCVGALPFSSSPVRGIKCRAYVSQICWNQTLTILIASSFDFCQRHHNASQKGETIHSGTGTKEKVSKYLTAIPIRANDHRGSDLPPPKSSSNPALDTNKAASRVLDALKHRQAYRERKKRGAGDDDGAEYSSTRPSKKQKVDATTSLRIQPGESIQHFSRQVAAVSTLFNTDTHIVA